MTEGALGADRAEVERAFVAESGAALATIARLTGDLDRAEDAVQEAFVAALRHWSRTGIPASPGAWITTTARNKALDVLRREQHRAEKEAAACRGLEATPPVLRPVPDDQLGLMFACCHPALAPPTRVALTLRFVSGLRTPEIARLLLQGEEAVAKRLQRAKSKIRASGIRLDVPPPERFGERLPSVLECTYLVFTEGYSPGDGDLPLRPELCDEGVRLARLIHRLVPGEPGPPALLALLLLQDSRRRARVGPDGAIVVLEDQDRGAWDARRIEEGRSVLAGAMDLAGRDAVGPVAAAYLLQAAIAAEHARAPTWPTTDWTAIVALYDQLLDLTASPVVAVNRVVAVSHADGPAVALALLDDLADDPRLARSHLLPAASADLHRRLGRPRAAAEQYRLAAQRAPTAAERDLFRQRLAELT